MRPARRFVAGAAIFGNPIGRAGPIGRTGPTGLVLIEAGNSVSSNMLFGPPPSASRQKTTVSTCGSVEFGPLIVLMAPLFAPAMVKTGEAVLMHPVPPPLYAPLGVVNPGGLLVT